MKMKNRMEFKKLTLAMAIASTTLLTACGGSSSSSGGGDVVPTDASYLRASTSVSVGDVCATVGKQSGQEIELANGDWKPWCELEGTITEDAQLTTDNAYRLVGYVTVGSGGVELEAEDGATPAETKTAVQSAGVTLTVDAGVNFRSSGRGSLIISRGSEIAANGTSVAPIIMSSQDNGYDGQGEWGGLVMQGFSKNNKCGEGSNDILCNTADEAGTGFHGGNDDADSSGSVEYLIVAEGGYEVQTDSEVNGITLHSVGYGTTIENVMVLNNADDGIEFFGGSVNVKNLILIDNSDESLDWDDGYRGNVQFSLIRQGLNYVGDHGIEADNKGRSTIATPTSNPTIANVTFQQVNATIGEGEAAKSGADDLFRFKEGTGATLVNVAADGYTQCVRMDGADTGQTQLVTLTNLIAECGSYSESENVYLTLEDGALETGITGQPTASTLITLGNAFEVTGGVAAVDAITPTSANGSTGFFIETNYAGAVDPAVTASENAWWNWAAVAIPAAFEQL
ncbi:MAG: hypothetical protein ACI910_000963 [Oleispira sp.]|jgi:hypothetical protein